MPFYKYLFLIMKYYNTKFICSVILFLSIIFSVSGQTSDGFWTKSNEFEKSYSKKVIRESIPKEFDIYKLNIDGFKSILQPIANKNGQSGKLGKFLSFPNDDGELELYEVIDAPIMEKELQNKFPNIRSYKGKGVTNESSRVRFSITSFESKCFY